MKNQILTSMITIGFAALLGSAPAAAQGIRIANIPFSFNANGVELPQGTYAVERINGQTIAMSSSQDGHRVYVPCGPQKWSSSLSGLLHQAILMMQAAKHRRLHNTVTGGQLVSVAAGRNPVLVGSGTPGPNDE